MQATPASHLVFDCLYKTFMRIVSSRKEHVMFFDGIAIFIYVDKVKMYSV